MRLDIVTIFPAYVEGPLSLSLIGKARERGLLDVRVHDLRQWAHGVHRAVDDIPYGGGPGMVMTPQPWADALTAVLADPPAPADQPDPGGAAVVPTLLVPTPSGPRLTQQRAAGWAQRPWLVVACGRYEGIDARVLEWAAERMPVEEVSLGDYVLAGGEVAALVVTEAVTRLLPGVLGNEASVADDSFAEGAMASLLEGPVFTRPPVWEGREVPAVLQSGDHGAIARWRTEQALRRTAERRPELLAGVDRDALDRKLRPLLDELRAAAEGGPAG